MALIVVAFRLGERYRRDPGRVCRLLRRRHRWNEETFMRCVEIARRGGLLRPMRLIRR